MHVPPDLKREAGVFALLHAKTSVAYVNEANDLRRRAVLWRMKLEAYEQDEAHRPARDFPRHPASEWEFWISECAGGKAHADTRVLLAGNGWHILNDFKPRKVYTIAYPDGRTHTGSLQDHCRRCNLNLTTTYKRIERGMAIEQALNLGAVPTMDKRELAISLMRVQIMSESGGLLTYDEAVQLRPAIGDVREKIRRMRRKDKALVQVNLSDIPI